eukprot:2175250-Pleurochrysis_carterae.AAC.1
MHVRSRTPAGHISALALRERDAESRARKATCMHVYGLLRMHARAPTHACTGSYACMHGLLRMHARAESWIHEGADGFNSLASHEYHRYEDGKSALVPNE